MPCNNLLSNCTIVLLMAFVGLISTAYSTSPKVWSVPIHRMQSPLKHLMLNAHLPKYKPLIQHLESLRDSKNTVPLFKFLDYEFYGKVLIGRPGQTFNVVFDTTWADLWVPSILCPSMNIACALRNKYDGSRSSCHVDTPDKYNAVYGKFNLTGKISMDLVHVGQVNITNQTFAELNDLPWREFMLSKADGIFGLSFNTLVAKGLTPFTYNLVKQKKIEQQIFSMYINRDLVTKKGGTLLLGGIDNKHYTGNLTYINVDPKRGFWEIPVQNITVRQHGQIKDNFFCVKGCYSLIDSSTNEIRGPENEIDTINELIGARQFMFGRSTVDCGTVNTLPHLHIMIQNVTYKLKGPDYVQEMNYGPVTLCLSSFTKYETEGAAAWIFGGAFLSKYYTVYDMEKFRIGFAPARL